MPSMNSVLATIAPAMEAFTRTYCPARNAASAISSSVRFPSVALSRPPIVSPVLAATDSVARLSRAANGTIARTESTNSSVCACGLSNCEANSTGTMASSQSRGLCRISSSRGFMKTRLVDQEPSFPAGGTSEPPTLQGAAGRIERTWAKHSYSNANQNFPTIVALHQRETRPSGFVTGLICPPGVALGSPVNTKQSSFERLVS